jgi:hypothetical protein
MSVMLIFVPCAYCGQPVPSRRAVRRCCDTCRQRRQRESNKHSHARSKGLAGAPPLKTRQEWLAERDARLAENFVPSPPASPIHAPPGSLQRLEALVKRFAVGEELFDSRDAEDWQLAPAGDHLAEIRMKLTLLKRERDTKRVRFQA